MEELWSGNITRLYHGNGGLRTILGKEYLIAENPILRNQITRRVRLTDGEQLGKMASSEVVSLINPETVLAWYWKLIARKFDAST